MSIKGIDLGTVDVEFLKQEFTRFREELEGMSDKLGDNAHAALDQIGAYLNGASLNSRVASLEEEFSSLAGKLKDKSQGAVSRLEGEVSERPVTSLALAFGAGLLAAQLFRRR
jgi:ElaB/YqjD/DUF883 family membrane-anchored ribosome-binding protein